MTDETNQNEQATDQVQTSATGIAGAGAAPAPKPSIGRIVHYRKATQEPRAAIITKVHNDTCIDLNVFSSDSHPYVFPVTSAVQIDPDSGSGQGWYWPPRS